MTVMPMPVSLVNGDDVGQRDDSTRIGVSFDVRMTSR